VRLPLRIRPSTPASTEIEAVKRLVLAQRRKRRATLRREDSIRGPRRPLDLLPPLDAGLKPVVPDFVSPLKDLWGKQTTMNMLYGAALDFKHRDPYAPGGWAWDDAVRSIAKRHAPPEPEQALVFAFDWGWPEKVSQSLNPLGVGDLEDDFYDGDEDD
jgi:hypothetical protein